MRKQYLIILLLSAVSFTSQAQQKDWGLPTYEVPGDPGIPVKKFTLNRLGNGKYFYLEAGPFAGKIIWIELRDKTGKIVIRRSVDVSKGSVISIFDCSDLPPGKYTIVVKSRVPTKTFWITL